MKDMHKILLRFWLVIWVITLPLVHIHPEADHVHGKSGYIHGGTYHSILVNTPVHAPQGHEQEAHHHDGFFSPGSTSGFSHSSSHPPYDFEEATYNFSVIKSWIVLESEKSKYSQDLVVIAYTEFLHVSSDLTTSVTLAKNHFSILSKNVLPRAPPVLSV